MKRIIRKCTPKEERQTLLFSATFNQDVLNLASMWTSNAEFVEIEPEQKTAERVEQTVYLVGDDEKLPVLVNFLKRPEVEKALVFANRRDQCRDLEEDLRNQGVKVALMSGEIAQNKRLKTLDQFKKGSIQVLVATDVAGRGIHVNGVTHVFNYNLPDNAEDYVHRIGRTGRAGKHGVSISFAGEDDSFALRPSRPTSARSSRLRCPMRRLWRPWRTRRLPANVADDHRVQAAVVRVVVISVSAGTDRAGYHHVDRSRREYSLTGLLLRRYRRDSSGLRSYHVERGCP